MRAMIAMTSAVSARLAVRSTGAVILLFTVLKSMRSLPRVSCRTSPGSPVSQRDGFRRGGPGEIRATQCSTDRPRVARLALCYMMCHVVPSGAM